MPCPQVNAASTPAETPAVSVAPRAAVRDVSSTAGWFESGNGIETISHF